MNDDAYKQLFSLITGGQQTPADQQPAQGPNWLQWLLQNKTQGGGGAGAGGSSGLSGMGSAIMKMMGGGGAAAGGAAGGGMLGAL